jgi:ESCRT-I complex subunit VPS28
MSQAGGLEPVSLYTTKAERDKYESFADLYALIKTVEKLEKAYVRDAVRSEEYEAACLDLIAKFKTLRTALRDDGVPDVEHFMATYRMDCASAAQRLLRSGLPATIEHRPARHGGRKRLR